MTDRSPLPTYDDEIDLRPYLERLIRYWWRIAIVAVIFGALAGILSLLQPRSYEATANILLTRTRSNLQLSQQYQTETTQSDSKSRLQAIMSIAQSDAVALQTIQALGDRLSEEERRLVAFKNAVEVTSDGDVLLISARAKDPKIAAEIANTWASQIVETINRAYSEDTSMTMLEPKVQSSQQTYETAQTRLEELLQSSNASLYEKQLAEAKIVLTSLVGDRAWRILYYSNRIQSMENLKVQAEALKQQLQSGARSNAGDLGDALAILNARAQVNSINQEIYDFPATDNTKTDNPVNVLNLRTPYRSDNFSFTFQISDLDSIKDTGTNYIADVDALIDLAGAEQKKAEEAMATLQQEISQNPSSAAVQAVIEQIGSIEANLEQENAKKRELTSQRDLAWQAYQALAQKEAELINSPQTTNEVSFASEAIEPEQAESRGVVRNTLIAGILGFIVACAQILGAVWWQSFNRPTAGAVE